MLCYGVENASCFQTGCLYDIEQWLEIIPDVVASTHPRFES